MADDALKSALDPGIEPFIFTAVRRGAPVGQGKQLPAFEKVGFGFFGGVVPGHAPTGFHGDRGQLEIPARAEPAVGAVRIVGDCRIGLHARPARGHFDGVAQVGRALMTRFGGLDEIDARRRVGRLDVFDGGGIEGEGVRGFRQGQGGVDQFGEVGGEAGDEAFPRIEGHPFEALPAIVLLIEEVGVHRCGPAGPGGLIDTVGDGNPHFFLEAHSPGQKAKARLAGGEVLHPGFQEMHMAQFLHGEGGGCLHGPRGNPQAHISQGKNAPGFGGNIPAHTRPRARFGPALRRRGNRGTRLGCEERNPQSGEDKALQGNDGRGPSEKILHCRDPSFFSP